jgi:hypothetical protein
VREKSRSSKGGSMRNIFPLNIPFPLDKLEFLILALLIHLWKMETDFISTLEKNHLLKTFFPKMNIHVS